MSATPVNGPHLNKGSLADAVAADAGLTRADALAAINATLTAIVRTVAAGGSVTLSRFGGFAAVRREERMSRNPQTGEPVVVPAGQRMRFLPAETLRAMILAADPDAVTIRKNLSR